MDDFKDGIKKYWPFLLGGLIAVYLLMRSSSAQSSSSSDYAAYLAAQAQNATAGQAAQGQQAQIDIANRSLDLQQQAQDSAAQTNYLAAQGGIIQAIGDMSGKLATALYQPALVAISSASQENQAALATAAGVAVGSYQAEGTMLNTSASSIQSVSQAVASMSNINVPQRTSPFDMLMQSATRLGTAYIQSPYTFH